MFADDVDDHESVLPGIRGPMWRIAGFDSEADYIAALCECAKRGPDERVMLRVALLDIERRSPS